MEQTFSESEFQQSTQGNFSDPGKLLAFLKRIDKFSADSSVEVYSYLFCSFLVVKEETKNMRRIIESIPYISMNFDMTDLVNSLANLGYITKGPEKVSLFSIDERLMPCMFFSKNKEAYLLLEYADESKSSIVRYNCTTQTKETVDISMNVKGSAYFFTKYDMKTDELCYENRQKVGETWFSVIMKRFDILLLKVLIISIFLALTSLSLPILIMSIYQFVVVPATLEAIPMIIIGIAIVFFIEIGLRLIRSKSLTWIGARLDSIVTNAIFEKLIKLPPMYIENASVSSQISRLRSFDSIRDFITSSLIISIAEIPHALILLIIIFIISPKLCVVPAIFSLLFIALIFMFYSSVKKKLVVAGTIGTFKQDLQLETLEKIDAIRGNGLPTVWLNKYRELSGQSSHLNFLSSFHSSVIISFSQFLYSLAAVITIYYGVHLIWNNMLNPIYLIVVLLISWKILGAFQAILGMLPRIVQFNFSVNQVNRLMDIESEAQKDYNSLPYKNLKGHISFNKVGLRYFKDANPVFTGLSFDITPGELMMICGQNGSGKSTILKLTNSLYSPQAGSIRIDGVEIRQLDLKVIRHNIAYMSQIPEFFFGTIAQNLRLAEPMATEEEIIEAIKLADAYDEVMSHPKGINTIIFKDIPNLNTALGYKLNLARIYINKSPILIIDELPYAILGSKTGENLKAKLLSWRGKKTVIMVTHRNDFLAIADQGVLLKTGFVPIVGKPSELLKIINGGNQ